MSADFKSALPSFPATPGIDADDIALMLERVPASVWDALRGQRLFITGGTGFLGCWLLEALIAGNARLDLGLTLTVLSRDIARFRAKAPHLAAAVCLREGDVTDLTQINDKFDVVIHAATDVATPHADPQTTYRNIVGGTEQTLALAVRAGAQRYLLTSSGAVYGRQPPDCPQVAESYMGAPALTDVQSAYGQAKRSSEWLVGCHANAMDVRIARCFAFVGPYLPLDAHFAIGNFIRDSLGGGPVHIRGDGSPIRSYLYAADLTIWLLTILIQGDAAPYNVGSDKPISLAQLAHVVSSTIGHGRAADVAIARPPQPGAIPERYVPDTTRARGLGLQEYTDLPQAIRKTALWHQPG